MARYLCGRPMRFCFPIKAIHSPTISLVPFDLQKHGEIFYNASTPEMYAHMSSGPYATYQDFASSMFLNRSYVDDAMFTYAIMDSHTLVGMISLNKAEPNNRSAHLSLLQVLPSAQGKGIATRAAHMLLWYAMSRDGLGLVRVRWSSTTGNDASIKLARNLGFREVGTTRYERLLTGGAARGKAGNVPPGTADGDVWRDVISFDMCWDDEIPSDASFTISHVNRDKNGKETKNTI